MSQQRDLTGTDKLSMSDLLSRSSRVWFGGGEEGGQIIFDLTRRVLQPVSKRGSEFRLSLVGLGHVQPFSEVLGQARSLDNSDVAVVESHSRKHTHTSIDRERTDQQIDLLGTSNNWYSSMPPPHNYKRRVWGIQLPICSTN